MYVNTEYSMNFFLIFLHCGLCPSLPRFSSAGSGRMFGSQRIPGLAGSDVQPVFAQSQPQMRVQQGTTTMNYPKKTGFNLYESRHCAYITYSVKTWFFKNLSVFEIFYSIKSINSLFLKILTQVSRSL